MKISTVIKHVDLMLSKKTNDHQTKTKGIVTALYDAEVKKKVNEEKIEEESLEIIKNIFLFDNLF